MLNAPGFHRRCDRVPRGGRRRRAPRHPPPRRRSPLTDRGRSPGGVSRHPWYTGAVPAPTELSASVCWATILRVDLARSRSGRKLTCSPASWRSSGPWRPATAPACASPPAPSSTAPRIGDSTAVNGCCLTIVAFDPSEGWWEADVSDETLGPHQPRALEAGDPVNLERPVRLDDRLGGHLVQGHVDGVGEVVVPCARPPDQGAEGHAALRRREGLDHRRRHLADRRGSARRRLHRGRDPPHRGGHHPRHQGRRGAR